MEGIKKLGYGFYSGKDVIKIAKQLLGKILITQFDGIKTAGRIVETEAYAGITDRASHAHGGRRTARTEIMYSDGGRAYVYLCYGIHHLFNVVTSQKDIPHAVLIRAIEPIEGIETMMKRVKKKKLDYTLTKGPGNLAKALGISTKHSGIGLLSNEIFIVDDGFKLSSKNIVASPRIGVGYAGKDAKLLYRFIIKENPWVSGRKN